MSLCDVWSCHENEERHGSCQGGAAFQCGMLKVGCKLLAVKVRADIIDTPLSPSLAAVASVSTLKHALRMPSAMSS